MKFSAKKPWLLSIIFLATGALQAQDSTWRKLRVDENLSILFPTVNFEVDTSLKKEGKDYRLRVLRAETQSSVLGILVTANETGIGADNFESQKIALQGMAKGSMNSLQKQGFICNVSDSVVQNMPCKKLTCTNENTTMISYIFLVNDKMYAIHGSGIDDISNNAAQVDLKRAMETVRFPGDTIKERQFASKAESLGYKIGKLFIPLLLIAIVIAALVRKKRKIIR